MSFRRFNSGRYSNSGARKPDEPEDRTAAEYTPGVSPIISQETAYAMLSALKMAVLLMDKFGTGVFGPITGRMLKKAMQDADREASNRR